MKAVIMAGGRGSRLAPYTTVLPKPLMPLTDRPVIDVVLRQLVRAGVEGIIISVGHLGSLIESWVRSEADYGVPVSFVYEDEPLGTAGALGKMVAPEGTFLALNGDILTTLSFAELTDFHRSSGAIATMAVKERIVDVEYGVVHTDEGGSVIGLDEKPRLPYTVSMGVYAFEPAIVEHIQPGERVDFPDLLLRAIAAGTHVAAYRYDGYWRDIGNRNDYEAAIADFGADPARFVS
jgi:NDP-sugar pyrophosphorylase family protein